MSDKPDYNCACVFDGTPCEACLEGDAHECEPFQCQCSACPDNFGRRQAEEATAASVRGSEA
jgi:hypothetical protein